MLAAESTAGPGSAGTTSPTFSTGPHRSSVNNVAENVRIANDLTVHGEAWKMGGSAQWRVLSDDRVKDVLSDFTLGGETLLKIAPRLFRYKGQAQHERPYVGIIAQELPEELAPYCRFRSRLAAAEHAARQTGSQDHGELQSDALQSATERRLAEELPGAAGLFGSAHSRGVQLPPVDDSAPAEELHPHAEVAWLFLVDLSALQFVLLHTAKGLQQQAPSGAATAAPRPRRSTHPPLPLPADDLRHATPRHHRPVPLRPPYPHTPPRLPIPPPLPLPRCRCRGSSRTSRHCGSVMQTPRSETETSRVSGRRRRWWACSRHTRCSSARATPSTRCGSSSWIHACR